MDDQGFDLVIFLDEQGGEKSHPIRRIRHQGRLYFSVIDIIAALEVSTIPPRTYWAQLKERVKEEGFEEAVSRILQFPLKSADGRLRKTDCADSETLLRLVQSISSKRVEWIKQFLARAGSQKLDEMAARRLANLTDAAFRAKVQEYLDRGYELDWASVRTQGDMARNELTDTWTDRGAQGPEFKILTATMHKGAFGLLPANINTISTFPRKKSYAITSQFLNLVSQSLRRRSGSHFTRSVIARDLKHSNVMHTTLVKQDEKPVKLQKKHWENLFSLRKTTCISKR